MPEKIDDIKDIRSKDYLYQFSEIRDNFDIIDKIGEGSFASVFTVKSKQYPQLKDRWALKFTIPTIDPKRIENELRILKKIGGLNNVIKLHYSFRIKDHVFMLMSYVDHKKFHEYYLTMDINKIRQYMENLLIALKYVHDHKFIHRDVKPNNFLYDIARNKFFLIDFGLAHSETYGDLGPDDDIVDERIQIYRINSSNNNNNNVKGNSDFGSSKTNWTTLSSGGAAEGNSCNLSCICGYRFTTCNGCRNKTKAQVRRGGTTGYRPPEVIMRYDKQTTAIDVWAVGIIFAIFLTGRYPFLRGDDDLDVFFDLIFFLSYERVQEAAKAIERHILINPKPKPLLSGRNEIEWIRSRCSHIRQLCLRDCSSTKANGVTTNDTQQQMAYKADHQFDNTAYDLLSKLLDPNCFTRVTCKDALNHPFFKV